LVFHNEPRDPLLTESLFFGKGNQRDVNIGVKVELVRMTVVLIVLVDPPLLAYADQQVAENEGKALVLPAGTNGKLSMPKVMSHKANLDEYEGQKSGVQELEPKVVEDQQEGQARRQQAEREDDLTRVVGGLLGQQPVMLDEPLQLSILIGPYVGR
jgi:hypothetical protein